MLKILDSITILVFYVLRLTNVDVFKTELTYAVTLCPWRGGVINIFQFCICIIFISVFISPLFLGMVICLLMNLLQRNTKN